MIGYVIYGELEAERWYNGGMSMKEAAAYLSKSTSVLRKLVKENKIPYSRNNYSNSTAFFHQTILNAWIKGEFPPGRVELMLDDEKIDGVHEVALKENNERLLGLVPKLLTVRETAVSNYKKSIRLSTISSQKKMEIEEYCLGLSVPAKLSNPHYLVRDTLQYKKAKKNSNTLTNYLNVNTSEDNVERALNIIDTLLKACERLGGIIKNKYMETTVCFGREEVKIGIKEKRKQTLHEKTKEELKNEARAGYSWAPTFDYILTGNLHFFIDEWQAPRKNWNDTENKIIEQSVSDIIITIYETAECLRLIRVEREDNELIRKNSELERRKLQELRKNEQLKFNDLEERAKDYQVAKSIRDYIQGLLIKKENTQDTQAKDELECYISWAQQKADWIDPLVNIEDQYLGKRRV